MAKSKRGQMRRMEHRDLDAVVAQYRTIAPGAANRPLAEVTDKLRSMMLEQPSFGDDAPHSLVHEGSDGRIVGFMGVIPRRWQLGERILLGATTTGFVVDAEHPDSMVSALWLARGSITQGQDFTFVDRPTPQVVQIFGRVGAEVLTGHGYDFRMPLRRHEVARQDLEGRLRYRRWWPAVARLGPLGRRIASELDARRPLTLPTAKEAAVDLEPATADTLYEARKALATYYGPCLVDDEALTHWQFDYMANYPSRGDFRWFIARSGGQAVGWMLYYVREDQPSEVSSIIALPKHKQAMVAALVRSTYHDGCTSLIGTTGAAMAHELIERGAIIDGGDRIQVRSKDPEIMSAFRSNRALVTGLEGEVWV